MLIWLKKFHYISKIDNLQWKKCYLWEIKESARHPCILSSSRMNRLLRLRKSVIPLGENNTHLNSWETSRLTFGIAEDRKLSWTTTSSCNVKAFLRECRLWSMCSTLMKQKKGWRKACNTGVKQPNVWNSTTKTG